MSTGHQHGWTTHVSGALHCVSLDGDCPLETMTADYANSLEAVALAARIAVELSDRPISLNLTKGQVDALVMEANAAVAKLKQALATLDARDAAPVAGGKEGDKA